MNINLIYPQIPAILDRHIPETSITACGLLSDLTAQIKDQLQQSAKDTPSATVNIITAPIEKLMRKLATQARTQPASANLNIVLQFGASAQDDRWHAASGWTVTSQPNNTHSNQLANLLITQALKTLGLQAITNQTAAISQREQSPARLLDIASSPTVLTTNLYIDNRQNADLLRQSSGISKLASVHAAAIRQYLELSQ